MVSTAAALNGVLVTVVCAMLLHSSMGQQTAPASAPALVPVPAPPVVDCPSYCNSQCYSNCTAQVNAANQKCRSDSVTTYNQCYDTCTASYCPGKSCVHSGCGYLNCTCEMTNARNCCQWCNSGVYTTYQQCLRSNDKWTGYCIMGCYNNCEKSCTQG